jgi:twitching motility protein PilU
MDISANLRALVSQRLVRNEDGKGRRAAIEILLNTTTIADKIFKGDFHEIKGIMEKSRELGMRTFDWSLFELYNDGHIAYEEAIRNADSANELRLAIKLKSQRGEPASAAFAGPDLAMHDYKSPAEVEEERKKELAVQEEKKRLFEADKFLREEQEARQLQKAQIEVLSPTVLPLEKLQLTIE